MTLFEIEAGSEITIEVSLNDEKLEFKTHVIEQLKDTMVIEPIRVNGKFLNVQAKGVKTSILYFSKNNPPMIWKEVELPAVLYKGESCYKCTDKRNASLLNRREAYRLLIGEEGVARIGTTKKSVGVLVKDISECGFAFIFRADLKTFAGEPVHLVFDVDDMHFNLQGRLVRIAEISENRYLYGCKITIPNPNVAKYIAGKQREKLAVGLRKKAEEEA